MVLKRFDIAQAMQSGGKKMEPQVEVVNYANVEKICGAGPDAKDLESKSEE